MFRHGFKMTKSFLYGQNLHSLRMFNFSQKILSIKLGDLGEGTKEATVKKWYKNVGEKVDEVIDGFIKGRKSSRSVN